MEMARKSKRIRAKSTSDLIAKTISYTLLITGSLLIFTPFYWMLSSSLKEPAVIFKHPPEWIPKQQVKVAVGDSQYGLSTMEIDGTKVRVAELETLADLRKTVRVLDGQPMAGTEYTVPRLQLTEIRTIAPKWDNYLLAMSGGTWATRKPGDPGWRDVISGWRTQRIEARAAGAGTPGVMALVYALREWLMATWPFALYLINTCIITFTCLVGQVGSAALVAYGFARIRFPYRDFWFIVLLSTIMLPPQVTLIPIFKIFTTIGWYDTFYPLTVPAFFGGGVFFIFLLRQYFMTIPFEMDEAARIDGAGTFGVFWRIILPQAKPALATVGIFSFMAHWNDFLGPLIYLSDPMKRTLGLALWAFQGEHATDWHLLMAASTVIMLPLLVIFFCAQKYFIQGVVISGVKG